MNSSDLLLVCLCDGVDGGICDPPHNSYTFFKSVGIERTQDISRMNPCCVHIGLCV